MSNTLNLSKPNRPIHVGVVLMGGETEILDVAPVDMFHGISPKFVGYFPDELLPPHIKAQAVDFRIHWVSQAGNTGKNQLTSTVTLNPTDSFDTCPPLDIVLIGAHDVHYTPNETELAFVRKAYETCSAFLTICGGVEVPRLAGILEGKTATAPRFALDMMRGQSPGTNWVEKRWVRDGKLWTSGALLNGTDMMVNFVNHYWGQGDDSLVSFMCKLGAWPDRQIDYKDVSWAL